MIAKDILIKALIDGEFCFRSEEHGSFILIPQREWESKLKDSQS